MNLSEDVRGAASLGSHFSLTRWVTVDGSQLQSRQPAKYSKRTAVASYEQVSRSEVMLFTAVHCELTLSEE